MRRYMEKINREHMCNMDIIKLIKSDGFNILIDDFQKINKMSFRT